MAGVALSMHAKDARMAWQHMITQDLGDRLINKFVLYSTLHMRVSEKNSWVNNVGAGCVYSLTVT